MHKKCIEQEVSNGYKETSWINITIAVTTRLCFRRREPHTDRDVACIPFFLLAAIMLRNGGRMP
jgi:hypothetical protein